MKQKYVKMVTLGFDPWTGKRVRKRVYSTTKSGLVQAEKDAIREFAKRGISSNMTYKQYEDRWTEANWMTIQPRTKAVYTSVLKKMVPLHNMKMSKISRTDIQKILAETWNYPAECKRLASLLNQIWRSAVLDNVVDKNIIDGIKTPKKAKSDRQALTQREIEAIRKTQFTEQEQFLIDVLWQFGLRPGEAFALGKRSFNRKTRSLTIDKAVSYNSGVPFIKGTKTGVTRVLPVPDSFWSKIPKCDGPFFFTDDKGQLYKLCDRQYMVKKILKKINQTMGGDDIIQATTMTLYTFRHNKASLLYYTPGISLKKKAEYMGHSERMFLQTYSHLMNEKEDIEILRKDVI